MICEICKKNQATFHYTEVVNGVKNEHHLCSECAANTDMSYYSSVFDNDQFGKLLSGILVGQLFKGVKEINPAGNVQCPNCKMTYGEFVKNSSFGCPECYDVFGPLIADKIKKIQGSDSHVGKHPVLYNKNIQVKPVENISTEQKLQDEIMFLSRRLKEAVAVEDFEEAARLRDLIAELKKGGSHE